MEDAFIYQAEGVWNTDNQLSVTKDGDMIVFAVSEEQAVDSYNDVFQCRIGLPASAVEQLREYLALISSPQ